MTDKAVRIFFSVGMVAGAALVTDLFLYELDGGRVTPLLIFVAACFVALVALGLFLIWRKDTP